MPSAQTAEPVQARMRATWASPAEETDPARPMASRISAIAVEGDVAQHDVLVAAEHEVAVAVAVGEVGEELQLRTVGVAHRDVDREQRPTRGPLGPHAGRPAARRDVLEDRDAIGVGAAARRRPDGRRACMRRAANAWSQAARKAASPSRSRTNFMPSLRRVSRSPCSTKTSTRASAAATACARGRRSRRAAPRAAAPCRGCRRPRARSPPPRRARRTRTPPSLRRASSRHRGDPPKARFTRLGRMQLSSAERATMASLTPRRRAGSRTARRGRGRRPPSTSRCGACGRTPTGSRGRGGRAPASTSSTWRSSTQCSSMFWRVVRCSQSVPWRRASRARPAGLVGRGAPHPGRAPGS